MSLLDLAKFDELNGLGTTRPIAKDCERFGVINCWNCEGADYCTKKLLISSILLSHPSINIPIKDIEKARSKSYCYRKGNNIEEIKIELL